MLLVTVWPLTIAPQECLISPQMASCLRAWPRNGTGLLGKMVAVVGCLPVPICAWLAELALHLRVGSEVWPVIPCWR